MYNIVADTNILVSSIFWNGNPYQIIQKGIEQKILIFTSNDILKELRRILARDFDIAESEIDDIINGFALFLHVREPIEKIKFIKEDPTDNIILECGVAAHATHIVSGDSHLLKLKEFSGIPIISAKEFLDVLIKE